MAKNLTDQQQLFLDSLFTEEAGGKIRKAMTMAGYSTKTSVHHTTKNLSEEIAEATRNFIATAAPQAVYELTDIFADPMALGNKNRLAAAKDMLDRAGFGKTERVEVTAKEPIFILPAKD